MDLPKVNIAVAASAVVAIVSTVGGGIWYASQQASVIESLTEQVNVLTIESHLVLVSCSKIIPENVYRES